MRRLSLLPLVLGLLVATAAPALAHATFDVTQLPASATQDVVLRVPLERDADNDLVEVLVPGAFTVTACTAAEGWSCTQQTTTDGDVVLTLGRDADGPGDTERFSLTLSAPAEEGVYPFPTIQTYADGVEAAWINDPGTDRPAPRIQVGDSSSEVAFADDASPHTATLDDEPTAEPTATAGEAPVEAEPTATPSPIVVGDEGTPDEPTGDDAAAEDDTADEDLAAVEGINENDSVPVGVLALGALAVAGLAAAVVVRRRGTA